MASASVRSAIYAAVEAAAAPLPTYDLSDYVDLDAILPGLDSEAVLVQYVSASEFVASIGGENNEGWEEQGNVILHLVVPTGFDSQAAVDKGDAIRVQLRGKRLTNQITVESCPPFVDFGLGQGVQGSWHSWLSDLTYTRRVCGSG